MTIDEAIKEIQGKSVGLTGRATVKHAQELLEEREKVFAAATANIQSHHGKYPGIIVFTDQRMLAVGGLPGIKRSRRLSASAINNRRWKIYATY